MPIISQNHESRSQGETGIQGMGLNFYDRRALQATKKKKVYAVAKLMKLCFN